MSTARYWRETPQRYRMEAGRCTRCGRIWFPPREICPNCRNVHFEKVTLAGEGAVETFTVIHENGVAVEEEIADVDDPAVRRRNDRRTDRGGNIHPGVRIA